MGWLWRRGPQAERLTAPATAVAPGAAPEGTSEAAATGSESPSPLRSLWADPDWLKRRHALFNLAFDARNLPPLPHVEAALVVGSGAAERAAELAERYADASVAALLPSLGADPTGQRAISLPENLAVMSGSIEGGLPFATGTFDYTSLRWLASTLPATQWPRLLAEAVRVTAPGGWVELAEAGLPREGGPAIEQLVRWSEELAARAGIDLRAGERLGEKLRAAGLQQVTVTERVLPVGGRPRGKRGKASALARANYLPLLDRLRRPLVAASITSPAEYERITSAALSEMRAKLLQPFYLAYGQRADA